MPQPDPPYVSICIPTLRGYKTLIPLIESIEKYTPQDHEIVIVDSASRTRGYTVPVNQALKAARGQIIVALNDDMEVSEGWLAPLIEAIDAGNPVVFPDIEDGEFCICGWCVAMSRDWLDYWGGYDERFVLWCTEMDLAYQLILHDVPATRVKIPNTLIHHGSRTYAEHAEIQEICSRWAQEDLVQYEMKYPGHTAPEDKTLLGRGKTYVKMDEDSQG